MSVSFESEQNAGNNQIDDDYTSDWSAKLKLSFESCFDFDFEIKRDPLIIKKYIS